MQNIKEFLKKQQNKLTETGIEACEAEWVICHFLGCKRSELKLMEEISDAVAAKAEKIIDKRIKTRKPLDRIFGTTNFYGRDFVVAPAVFKPRFETEELVCEALKLAKNNANVLDLGTGSGVIAISMAAEKPLRVVASDISSRALAIAKRNAKKNKVKIKFIKSNVFEHIHERFDLIVCNPPYIKSEEIDILEAEVKYHDPRIALDGGDDGFVFYKKIVKEAQDYLMPDGVLCFEVGIEQASRVTEFAKSKFNTQILKDYAGRERFVILRRKA